MGLRQVDRIGLRSAVTSLNGMLGIASKKNMKKIFQGFHVFSPYSLRTSLGVFRANLDFVMEEHCWASEVATSLNAVESCTFSNI